VIQKHKTHVDKDIVGLEEIVNKFSLEYLNTAKEDLERYDFLKTRQRVVRESSKNRKKTAQEMRLIEDKTKTFGEDFKRYEKQVENCKYLNNLRERRVSINDSIENEIKPHLKILEKHNFIARGDCLNEYDLTEWGKWLPILMKFIA